MSFVGFDSGRTNGGPSVNMFQMLQMFLRMMDFMISIFMAEMMDVMFVILNGRVDVEFFANFTLQLFQSCPQTGNIGPQLANVADFILVNFSHFFKLKNSKFNQNIIITFQNLIKIILKM